MACHFIFRHPAPLLAYPSGLGSPKVDLQQKKKEGERGQEAETHVGETAPKKEKKQPVALFHNGPNVAASVGSSPAAIPYSWQFQTDLACNHPFYSGAHLPAFGQLRLQAFASLHPAGSLDEPFWSTVQI